MQDALDEVIDTVVLPRRTLDVFPGTVDDMARTYQVVQAMDIISALGLWLKEVGPRFGPTIGSRFAGIYDQSSAEIAAACAWRDKLRLRLADFFATHPRAVVIVPSAPCVALPRGLAGADIAAFYRAALATGAVASLAGVPQVSIPVYVKADCPLGLGLLRHRAEIGALLAFATSHSHLTNAKCV